MNEKWIVTRLTIFFFFYFVIMRRYWFGLLCLMFILIPLFSDAFRARVELIKIFRRNGIAHSYAAVTLQNDNRFKSVMLHWNASENIMQVSVRLLLLLSYSYFSEAHSEPSQTSKLKLFVKILNSWKAVNYFRKTFHHRCSTGL